MPKPFNPDQHCGGTTKKGTPCTRPKGFATHHPGTGHCHLHDQENTTEAERSNTQARPGNQHAVKHGLYAKVLAGAAATRYAAVEGYDPAEILKSNFLLIQSRILGILEGDVKYSDQAQAVLGACNVLIEEGLVDEDFVDELKLKLVNLDTPRLSALMNSTVNLANSAVFLDRMGDVQKQLSITTNFLRTALRVTSDRTVRELGLAAIQELKLEAGMPLETINQILEIAAMPDSESGAENEEESAIEDSE